MLFLTEVGIKHTETDLYRLKDYTAIWLTREETAKGGGLAIFVKNKLVPYIDFRFCKLEENDLIEMRQKENFNNVYVQKAKNRC